jgi:hypothetical protein
MCREARFGVAVGVREHHLFEKKRKQDSNNEEFDPGSG